MPILFFMKSFQPRISVYSIVLSSKKVTIVRKKTEIVNINILLSFLLRNVCYNFPYVNFIQGVNDDFHKT